MIRKILVYTYGDNNQDHTIGAAANFAAQHGAELTGLFVRPDFMNYSTVFGEYPLNLAQTYYDLQKDYAATVKNRFDEITASAGCTAEWHEVDEYERQPQPALYSDFVFVSQPCEESSAIFNDTDFIDHLIMQTGIPTIVVPAKWTKPAFGAHPLLGWKETREAANAVRHTLPLMRKSETVDIVTATKSVDQDKELINGIEISAYLAAHEINCKYFTAPMADSESDESETLLRHAHENSCDLVIVGGYGHSRFRQIVLGGVTRGLLRNSDIPVLLSH